jgi:hypothetical protein
MKKFLFLLVIPMIMQACSENEDYSSVDPINWKKRMLDYSPQDSLIHGTTYLSVYSQIYDQSEHRTYDLTATVSLRNTNRSDTVFIDKAEYFNTAGESTRTYFDQPIYIAPMETVEIVIDEWDREGGTGANFLFGWTTKPNLNEPLFEAVMISTSGQQGISFTTSGKRIN